MIWYCHWELPSKEFPIYECLVKHQRTSCKHSKLVTSLREESVDGSILIREKRGGSAKRGGEE